MEWATPRNVDEVISFIGLESYYRGFIMNFSWTNYLITSLHRKGKKFEWTKEYASSFEQFKHLLINAPILKIVVCIDDCKEGIVGVTFQGG